MNASADLAVAVVSALCRGGVSDVVLAPGSRSAALAVALHEADVAGLLRLHVRIDERTAGFLALGLAKGSHQPVAVVTTSGSAVANLHPAALEASHVGESLIVLSADRPASLRGTGANQTTIQAGLLGDRVPCVDVPAHGAVEAAEAVQRAVRRHGPSQINLQFGEPLLPDSLPMLTDLLETSWERTEPRRRSRLDESDSGEQLESGPLTVAVAGDDAGPAARMMAQQAHWPLLAEPTSGARTGTHALRTYRLLLESELGRQIERVVVTGHPTLSRPVTRLISRSDIEVVSVRGPAGVCTDPGRVAVHVDTMPAVEPAENDSWVAAWRAADAKLAGAVDEVAAADAGAPLRVAAEIAHAVTPGALLVVGSSQPIRDLDIMASPYTVGERRRIIGNRGLAGIDGTLSTAIGAALGRPSSRSLAYVGDVTFLHDANALVMGPDEPRPDLTIVVANDDGGAVFATLEQGGQDFAGSFERVFGTPHGVDVEALCRATQTSYERIDDPADLRTVLARDVTGIRVVEVPLSRASRRSLAEQLRALV